MAEASGPPPEHRLLVERLSRAAEAESVEARARQWRDATPEYRLQVTLDLSDFCAALAESTGYNKPPLAFPRFSSTGQQRRGT